LCFEEDCQFIHSMNVDIEIECNHLVGSCRTLLVDGRLSLLCRDRRIVLILCALAMTRSVYLSSVRVDMLYRLWLCGDIKGGHIAELN
jgi:hypothetical protein